MCSTGKQGHGGVDLGFRRISGLGVPEPAREGICSWKGPGGSAIARGDSGSDAPVDPEPKKAIACGSPASAANQVVIARVSGNQGYDCTRQRVNWTGVISCMATDKCVSCPSTVRGPAQQGSPSSKTLARGC